MSVVEETLAAEAEQRPRAFATAIAAALISLAGGLLVNGLEAGRPSSEDGFIGLTESLQSRLAGGAPEEQSLVVARVEHWGDNAVGLIVGHVLVALGTALALLALLFVYRATVARDPKTTRIGLFAIAGGLVLFPVGLLLRWVPWLVGAAGFDGGTAAQASDAVSSPVSGVGQLLELLGAFAVGLSFIIVALNAMRVGLLTRFLGILGVLVGFLVVLPLGGGAQIVRAIWLGALALLISGRRAGGLLPAWQSGQAEPWPTQQQLREQRDAQRAGATGSAAPPPERAPAQGAVSAQKRKRKKRR